LRRGNKLGSCSESEALHLDNLLDDALKATFPASDPVAITIDRPSKGSASERVNSPGSPAVETASREEMASEAEHQPPIFGFYDANLWGLRQISFFFNWWSSLLLDAFHIQTEMAANDGRPGETPRT
jgi:hypothetical protein